MKQPYSEHDLSLAVTQVRAGEKSIRQAAKDNKVPRTTLSDRLNSLNETPTPAGRPTFISPKEEGLIADWAIRRALICCPVTRKELLNTIEEVYNKINRQTSFKQNRPSNSWFYRFQKRHNLALRRSEDLDGGRTRVTEQAIRDWFSGLRTFLCKEGCEDILGDPSRIFNADEAAFQLEPNPKSVKLVVPKGIHDVFLARRNNGKRSVTIMASFAASGESLPPFFVFPYERVPTMIKQQMPPGWGLGNSKKGWMTNECFLSFLREHFFPYLKSISNLKFPVLLCVDGASSHISLDVAEFCRKEQIVLYAILSNTTHILQPADVAIFGPLKKKWLHGTRQWLIENGETVSMYNVAKVFETVWNDISPDVTRSGFKACGLYPFDPDAVDYSKCVPVRVELFNKPVPLSPSPRSDLSPSPQEEVNVQISSPKGNDVADHVHTNSNSAFKFFQDKMMPLLPSVAQFHFETSIGDALLSEFRKTMEEGGKWNGDVKHTSLYSYWVTFHSEYQEESLDQLAEALPPLPNPVAPMIRSTKRIDAITSQESLSMLREKKRKRDLQSGKNIEFNDRFSDEGDPGPPPSPVSQDVNQVDSVTVVTDNNPNNGNNAETTAILNEKCNICGKLLKDVPKKRGRPKKIKTEAHVRCALCFSWFHRVCLSRTSCQNAYTETSFTCPDCASSSSQPADQEPQTVYVDLYVSEDGAPNQNPTNGGKVCNVNYDLGLPNLGNTCFMNAAFQVLFHLKFFMEDIETYILSGECSDPIVHNIHLLSKRYSDQTKKAFLQEIVTEMSKFYKEYSNLDMQHDCGEFLSRTLDHINGQPYGEGLYSPVEMSFNQTVVKIHRCQSCGDEYVDRFQNQSVISVVIPSCTESNLDINHAIDFRQILSNHFNEKPESYTCNYCGHPNLLGKYRYHKGIPRVLVFTLGYTNLGDYIRQPPDTLKIDDFISDPNILLPEEYHLKAQIVHIGNSNERGHYVAYVKENGMWKSFDDQITARLKESDVVNQPNRRPTVLVYVMELFLDY